MKFQKKNNGEIKLSLNVILNLLKAEYDKSYSKSNSDIIYSKYKEIETLILDNLNKEPEKYLGVNEVLDNGLKYFLDRSLTQINHSFKRSTSLNKQEDKEKYLDFLMNENFVQEFFKKIKII